MTTGITHTVSTHPINTRNGFGGTFFGDYTDIAVGSDNQFHAFYTDSNNKQTVVWFYEPSSCRRSSTRRTSSRQPAGSDRSRPARDPRVGRAPASYGTVP